MTVDDDCDYGYDDDGDNHDDDDDRDYGYDDGDDNDVDA